MVYSLTKRIFDIVLSLIGLFIFLPLILLISILIFCKDGLPLFYIKKSLGKDGRIFGAIKFRSMEKDGITITETGKVLRQTAMDELPQLINIFKGEMSFVGPRTYGVETYGFPNNFRVRRLNLGDINGEKKAFAQRLEVTPGLTGLAQVYAPKHATDEEVLKWDLEYIKRKNFWLDISVVLISGWITFKRRWERTTKKL